MKSSTVAFRWSSVLSLIKMFTAVGLPLVLMRILGPEVFGLIAIASVLTNLSRVVAEMGTGDAVIREKELAADFLSSIFWLNVFLGGSITVLLWIVAFPYSATFDDPDILLITLFLSGAPVIQSISVLPVALFKREREFRRLTEAEFFSFFISTTLTLCAALNGWDVWSLVVLALSKPFLYAIYIFVVSKWKPTMVFRFEHARAIMSFSGAVTLTKILHHISTTIDDFFVGASLGPGVLGLYSRAKVSLRQVGRLFFGVYNPILYSTITASQGDFEYLRKLFSLSIGSLLFVLTPVVLMFSLRAEDLVDILFGEHWLAMAPLLPVISTILITNVFFKISQEFLKCIGKAWTVSKVYIITTPFIIVGFIYAVESGSIVNVAVVFAIGAVLRAGLVLVAIMRELNVDFSPIIAVTVSLLVRGLIAGGLVLSLDGALASDAVVRVLVDCTVILVAYLGTQVILPVPYQREVLHRLNSVLTRRGTTGSLTEVK